MIVKKEDYKLLPNCLSHIYQHMDEIIVVVDKIGPEIEETARNFGFRLFERKFSGDFSEYRNFSIRQATKDWILILDADELLSPEDLQKLRQIAGSGEHIACMLNQINYTNDTNQLRFVPLKNQITELFGFSGMFVVPIIRFFKNSIGLHFTRRVHEMVDETIAKKGIWEKVNKTDIPLHHLKLLKGPEEFKKTELRYLGLSELETADNPQNFKAFFDIGTTYLFTERKYPEAIKNLKKSLDISPDFLPAKLNLAYAYCQTKEYENALDLYKKTPENYRILSNILTCLFYLKKYKEALDCCEKLIALEPSMRGELKKKIGIIKSLMG